MSGFCHFPRKERGEKEVFQLRVSHSFSLVANDMPHRLGRPSPRLFTAHKGLWMRIYSSFTHSQEGPPSLFNVTKSLSTGTRAVGLLLSKGFQMGVDILKPVGGGSRSFFFFLSQNPYDDHLVPVLPHLNGSNALFHSLTCKSQ